MYVYPHMLDTVGNIFRCEILLVAGVHPEVPGKKLTRAQFDTIWAASVRLMGRAFALGSIVTVEPQEAAAVGKPKLRRWIYNSPKCGRCDGPVRSWQINARTCYACQRCQPLDPTSGVSPPADAAAPVLFNSHCVSESLSERLASPQKLRVAELRAALQTAGLPTDGKKAELVARMQAHLDALNVAGGGGGDGGGGGVMRSARAAAADKSSLGESRAVEHVAELEDLEDEAPEWVAVTPAAGAQQAGGAQAATPAGGSRKRKAVALEVEQR